MMRTSNNFSDTVVIVGATGMDDIARPLHGMHAGASNPVCWQRFAGGVATNVAREFSRKLSAHLITVIGEDLEGQTLVGKLGNTGITVAPFSAPNSSTGSYTAVLDEQGELFVGLSDYESIELLTWELIAERLPATISTNSTDGMMHAIVLDANLSQQCITDTVIGLSNANTRIFALTVSPAKAIRWLPVANKVYVLLCNRAEAAALTSLPGNSSLECLADGLADAGFRQFVISDGGSPALVQEIEHPERESVAQQEEQGSVARHWVSVSKLPDGREKMSTVNGAGDAMAAATIAHYVQQSTGSLAKSLKIGGMPAAVEILTGERSPLSVE